MNTPKLEVVQDPVADALDDLAALGTHWTRNRDRGRMPSGIRAAMVMVARELDIVVGNPSGPALTCKQARQHLSEQVPGFMTMLAISMGVTLPELNRRLECGQVPMLVALESLARHAIAESVRADEAFDRIRRLEP